MIRIAVFLVADWCVPRGEIINDSIMVTDSNHAYPKFAEEEHIQLEQIEAAKHTKGAFNLARINQLHSDLAVYWSRDKENIPATKYMDLSLMLFWWMRKNKNITTDEQVDALYKMITNPELNIDLRYETITNRENHINMKGLVPKSITKL